jgi:hypothetical protein
MFTVSVTSILVGVALGLRLKVLILVSTISLAVVAVNGISRADGSWRVVLAMIVIATCLQLGYFSGAVMRSMRRLHTTADRKGSIPT